MGIRKKLAKKTIGEPLRGKEEYFLALLRKEVKKQGVEGGVDAAMERIERSGLRPIFDQLGITRDYVEEALREREVEVEEK